VFIHLLTEICARWREVDNQVEVLLDTSQELVVELSLLLWMVFDILALLFEVVRINQVRLGFLSLILLLQGLSLTLVSIVLSLDLD